jgi:DNA-directed RNA polymerase specialized sigma24 family protein
MRRTLGPGRSSPGSSSSSQGKVERDGSTAVRGRDVDPVLIRLAQLHLECCRTGRATCPLLDGAWRRFREEVDAIIVASGRARRIAKAAMEDHRQDSWREIFVCLPGYRHDPCLGRFRDWVFVLASRTLARLERRAGGRRLEPLPDGDAWEGREPDPGDSLDRVELRRALIRSLAILRRRAGCTAYFVVVLRLVGGHTEAEVGDRLGLSSGQVRGHLDRARPRLRASLEDPRGRPVT